jgi:hypothetical protein
MDSVKANDPRCPECGGPIGMTASYCMHCSTDLTEEREREQVDADADGEWNGTNSPSSTPQASVPTEDTTGSESLLDPDGLLDNSLTVVVGIIGGLVIGLIELLVVTGVLSVGWGFAVGILAWLGATAYLVQRRTVQEAISKAAYGIAIAIMSFPLIVFSSTWDTNTQGLDFVILAVICAFPAAIVAVVGFVAGRFIPDSSPGG